MKLFEVQVKHDEPRYGWLKPERGPNNINGVTLYYMERAIPITKQQIRDAEVKNDTRRAETLRQRLQNYINTNNTDHQPIFWTPIEWWWNKESFEKGQSGSKGLTKGDIFSRYPDLRVFTSQKEAIEAAKADGYI